MIAAPPAVALSRPSANPASLTACVFVHPGHQAIAEQLRRELLAPPVAIVPKVEDWLPGEPRAAQPPVREYTDWWNPYWRHRIPLSPPEGGWWSGRTVRAEIRAADLASALGGAPLDPGSLRVVAEAKPTDPPVGAPAALAEPPTPGSEALLFQVPLGFSGGDSGRIWVYFGSQARGPRQSVPGLTPAATGQVPNGDFEHGTESWQWSDAELSANGHSGQSCARLWRAEPKGYSLIANAALLVVPDAQYHLRFWARTGAPDLLLKANFYESGRYDFPQEGIALTGDGAWHPYEVTLRTGEFPPGLRPALRLWLLEQAGEVLVDDITLEPVEGTGRSAQTIARALEVQSR